MSTARLRLSLWKKILVTTLELAEIQTGQIFDVFFEREKLIGEYFESKF